MTCKPPVTYCDPHDVGALENPLRDRIYTAMHDAPTGGLVAVSLRRTPWMQYLLREQRVPAGHECDPAYKGSPVTALPGVQDASGRWISGSKHQRGEAADMGGRDLPWLIANAHRYGLARTVPSENWHFEAVGTPTVRILTYPGAKPPATIDPPKETDDMTPEQAAMLHDVFEKTSIMYDQLIGTKKNAGTESLRQLFRETAADADAAEKHTRP